MTELLENDQHGSPSDVLLKAQLPPIGIIDLMVLTAAMSLSFALRNQFRSLGWFFQTDAIWFTMVEHICSCLYCGLPMAAAYRFYVQKKLTGRFLLEPGHWVLWSILLVMTQYLFTLPVLHYLGNSSQADSAFGNAIRFLPNIIFGLVSSGILFWGAMKFGVWWRVVLIVAAIGGAAQVLQMCSFYLSTGSTSSAWSGTVIEIANGIVLLFHALTAIGVLMVATKEVIKGPRRDPWHWAGVLLLLIESVAFPILTWVYMTYLFDPSKIG